MLHRSVGSVALVVVTLSGCYGAGGAGRITDARGLEATCANTCAEFKSDGTGCAVFTESTTASCAAYFERLCAASPGQCDGR